MGHLAPGEIFENMLQLKRFVLYFEGILNKKWLLSHRNNYISYRDARGFGDMLPQKFWNDWCNLVRFDVLFWSDYVLKKYHYLL